MTAGAALREEFGLRGHGPVLLLGGASFGLSALAWAAHPAWTLALALWLGYVLAFGLTAGLGWLLLPQRWPAVLALVALCVLLGAAAGWGLELTLNAPLLLGARAGLHLGFVGLLLFVPLGQAALRQRALRRVEAERARVQAELQMLQAQIEPHFLFNTLATLRSLVRQQSADALPLLDRMTAFLEAVLPQLREPQSTLGRELQIVDHYLAIMALRLAPRLQYRIELDAALHELPLPPLLLQPLVENAVLHGIEPCESGGQVLLSGSLVDGVLQLCIANTGTPPGQRWRSGSQGLALRNLRERLQALYGERACFSLQADADGTKALITLPISSP